MNPKTSLTAAISFLAMASTASAADYRMPFPAGEQWTISRGYKQACSGQPGESHCDGSSTEYALDFNMQGYADLARPVLAAADGTILTTNSCPPEPTLYDYSSQFGCYVKIQHDDGEVTLYAHLSTISVADGDYVLRGEIIGLLGTTGFSSGPHLHFQRWTSSGDRVPFISLESTNYIQDQVYTSQNALIPKQQPGYHGYSWADFDRSGPDPIATSESMRFVDAHRRNAYREPRLHLEPVDDPGFPDSRLVHTWEGAPFALDVQNYHCDSACETDPTDQFEKTGAVLLRPGSVSACNATHSYVPPDETDSNSPEYDSYDQAYAIRAGFWNYYRFNNGPQNFGSPCEDEEEVALIRIGRFEGGSCVLRDFLVKQRFTAGIMVWTGPGSNLVDFYTYAEMCQSNNYAYVAISPANGNSQLTIAASGVSESQVTLSLDSDLPNSHYTYDIYRDGALVASTPNGNASIPDNSVAAGATYQYQAHAHVDGVGAVKSSNVETVSTPVSTTTGSLRVSLSPQEAVQTGGARWRPVGFTQWLSSGNILPLPLGQYTVEFKDTPFWSPPPSVFVELTAETPDLWIPDAYHDVDPYQEKPPPPPPGAPEPVEWSEIPIEGTWPPATDRHALAYDSARQRLVLFGGYSAETGVSNQTWEFDGTTWQLRTPTTTPPNRVQHTMTYDPTAGVVVLFGGHDNNGNDFGDTWVWDGVSWSQKFPATSPSPRSEPAMAYFPELGESVLDGGLTNGSMATETWHWSGSQWTFSSGTTFGGLNHALTYDSALQRILKYMGDGTYTYRTFSYNGVHWSNVQTSNPSECFMPTPAFSYSHLRRRAVLIGGWRSGEASCPNGTWEFDGTAWQPLATVQAPPRRDTTAMVDAPGLGGTYVYGGDGFGVGLLQDLWILSRPPAIGVSVSGLDREVSSGENAAAEPIDLWNASGGSLHYTLSDDAAWLSLAPSSGVVTKEVDTISVEYSTSGLAPGEYSATIEISSPESNNSPVSIPVSLTVSPPPDPDGDGLTTSYEQTIGTDPANYDSDGDGFGDGEEVAAGSDPNDPGSTPPTPAVPVLPSPIAMLALIVAILASSSIAIRRTR